MGPKTSSCCMAVWLKEFSDLQTAADVPTGADRQKFGFSRAKYRSDLCHLPGPSEIHASSTESMARGYTPWSGIKEMAKKNHYQQAKAMQHGNIGSFSVQKFLGLQCCDLHHILTHRQGCCLVRGRCPWVLAPRANNTRMFRGICPAAKWISALDITTTF